MKAARSAITDTGAIIALGGPGLAAEVGAVLAARGLAAQPMGDDASALAGQVARGAVVGWAADEPIGAAAAAALASGCEAGARAGRPVVVLAPPVRGGRSAIERAAALAYLLAAGAIVVDDPDVWLEALVLVAAIGVPAGPRAAVIAPPGSWIDRAARALGAEAEARGGRGPAITDAAADLDPTDAALVDRAIDLPAQPRSRALIVPVVARAELLRDATEPALIGVRAALAAVIACGRASERAAAGLGPAPASARDSLEIDDARAQRQLDKVSLDDARVGDHEAKVLLAAYGVPITRQAVATTPSAAIRIAKKAGYPVELKPWGADVATERAGCPVEKNITTAAEVRRAFLAVLGAAGMPVAESEGAAVIVREAPPSGREVTATFESVGALGWTCVVEVAGAPPIAAPAPLRVADAERLAAAVASTRAGEAEPDRTGLANVLRRASHLAADHAERIAKLELGRIVIGARGARTLVVDASIDLR
ncbi:MAG TPA: acetate--CoA ligase family protein [Kofleriaceae bacterium]|nr:acetate--CoA ligase family protein [Kofleriaceae bacterium]